MMARRNKQQQIFDVWPGFVDAISTLLLLFVFMMALFSVISFSLGESLSGKKEKISSLESELNDAESQKNTFAHQLDSLKGEASAYEQQVSGLSQELKNAKSEQEKLLQQLGELIGLRQEESLYNQEQVSQLNTQIVALEATRNNLLNDIAQIKTENEQKLNEAKLTEEELNNRIVALTQNVSSQQEQLSIKSQVQIDAEAEIINLREQIGTLSTTLKNVESALSQRDEQIAEQKIEISTLGNRINEALASEVNQLQAYRSEFFGNLKQALGNNEDIKIEGDRFVISSGVLFNSASAELGNQGLRSVNRLAETINIIGKEIPNDIDWVIRVDGHTDNIPYTGTQYKDNWALSNARALSVVHQLIAQGVSPNKLVAAGFGEFHPINQEDTPDALAQNRRIEIKLTQK